MSFLVPLYIVGYFGLSLWGILLDLRFDSPRWKAVLSTVGNALGTAGMCLWYTRSVTPEISLVWRGVFGFLVVATAVEAVFELRVKLRRVYPDEDLGTREARAALAISFVLGLALAVPYFVMNWQVAFGAPPA